MAIDEKYSHLKDLKISLDREGLVAGEDGGIGFSFCLWIYLSSSSRPSCVIVRQVLSDGEDEAPFLALNEENKLSLSPLIFLNEEISSPDSSFSRTDIPQISAEVDCPLEKWVHVGCEVATDETRLHVNGALVRAKPLSILSNNTDYQKKLKNIALMGNTGNDGKLQGYIYNVRVLPISASIKDHFIKNPPVKLTLDSSCISDGVEEGGDGVWNIVGGKASCRRNFSLDVVLLDALGRPVHKEMEIIASLIYADSGTPVERTRDNSEAPLLTSCDGLEFPSMDRPVTLLRSRATFKLKISQLSSKSDNRLFRVCFRTTHPERYPFLEAYSHPIRCISRNRTYRSSGFGKRPLLEEAHSLGTNDGPHVIHEANGGGPFRISSLSELKCSPSFKRFRIGLEKTSAPVDATVVSKQDEKPLKAGLKVKSNNLEGTDSAPSDSESTGARNVESRQTLKSTTPISDATIFKYCLEGMHERSILLKEIAKSASNGDITNFAEQVCLYAGCSHQRYQILMTKQLIREGADAWNSIFQNGSRVLWTDAVPEINKRFMRIARSTTRSLSGKDLEILRGIAGCGEELGSENFERMWYWLYPVAFTLSKAQINEMWECTKPRWIEGLITKEEAESSLKGPRGLQKPGTFILRFPTSRSWPHPDAGTLVITYVGADLTVHNKLLSLDLSSDDKDTNVRQLQTLLLEESELSQLGRVILLL